MGDTPEVNSADVVRILDELLEGWTAFVGDPNTVLSRWGRRQEIQVTAVLTLVSHVHATATHLRPALPDGLTIVHMPLVRSILDATLTAVWCDEVADGANALVNEAARQRTNLIETLQQTQTFGKITDELQISDQDRLPSSSNQQARSAKERFDDIALDGAYALYRLLSGMSHISTETIDAYLYPAPADHSIRIKVNPDPMAISAAWTHLIACCLMWSGRVVDYLDGTHTRRRDLRRAAHELGVTDVLPVRYTAHQRGSQRTPS